LCCPDAGSADHRPLDVHHRTVSESHTDTEIWPLLLPEEEEAMVVVAEVVEGEEVVMTETPIVLVLQGMLRPETEVIARGAEVRLAGVPVGVAAEVRAAVLRLRDEEEVLEEEVEGVEVPEDAEAQAIPATAHAAEVEAETADAERSWRQTNSPTWKMLGKRQRYRSTEFWSATAKQGSSCHLEYRARRLEARSDLIPSSEHCTTSSMVEGSLLRVRPCSMHWAPTMNIKRTVPLERRWKIMRVLQTA
jgi:hypothetical protein